MTRRMWATGVVLLAAGCSSSSDDPSTFSDASTGHPPATTAEAGAAAGDDTASDAAVTPTCTTSVRFAHLAPGLGSVDFCWRASANDPFQGPLLGGGPPTTTFDAGYGREDAGDGGPAAGDAGPSVDASAGRDAGDAGHDDAGRGGDASIDLDAGVAPLGYLTVSPTLSITSTGEIDVIAIEPGSSCAAPLVLGHVSLASTARMTLLLAGGVQADASGGLGISAFEDETSAADPTRASVRVINAALVPSAGSFAATLEQSGYDVPLADHVPPGAAATASDSDAGAPGAPAVDALGYTTVNPTVSAPAFRILFARGDAAAGDTWASQALPDAFYGNEVTTAFVGHDDDGYLVLLCNDSAASSTPSYSVAR